MANIIKRKNQTPVNYDDVIQVKKIIVQEPRPLEEVIEGRELVSLEIARIQAREEIERNPKDQSMHLGGVTVNTKTNVFYSGLTQMGKTSVMKVHLYEILERIKNGSPEKLILFASSSEFIPFVYAFVGDEAPVYILNPSDARCYQWDLSKDLKGASNTQDVSQTLLKDKEGDTPFFTEGARSLLGAVINAFYLSVVKDKKRLDWTLKDVACAMLTPERIRAVLGLQPAYLSHITEAFLDRQNQDVHSSLSARTQEVQIIASMWDGRPCFSLKEFLDPAKTGGVLILGADANNRTTVLELNRLILERAGKLIADREECQEARYWFFLDEFQHLGKSEILKQLVKDGLKRGVRVHLACQDKSDIIGTYGKEDASVLFSQCGTHYIFNPGDEDNAEQARKAIGKHKIRRWTRSNSFNATKQEGTSTSLQISYSCGSGSSHSDNGKSTTTNSGVNISFTQNSSKSEGVGVTIGRNETILEEAAVSTGGLQELSIGEFYCVTPTVKGFWKNKYRWEVLGPIVRATSSRPEHACFIEREDLDLCGFLKDWTELDLRRLGLSQVVMKSTPKEKPTTTPKEKHEPEQSLINKLNSRFG